MKSLQIFIAVSLGIAIGTMLSLSLWPAVWWLGVIIGGAVGYFGYCFREVTVAIAQAARGLKRVDWKAVGQYGITTSYLYWVIMMWVLPGILAGMFILFSSFEVGRSQSSVPFGVLASLNFIVADIILVLALFLGGEKVEKRHDRLLNMNIRGLASLIIMLNPITMLTYWPVCVLCILVHQLVQNIRKIIGGIYTFTKTVIIQIHSRERLLCLLDAALGTAIGHFVCVAHPGLIIVWAIIGGLLGVAHYELISKRLLKVVPS